MNNRAEAPGARLGSVKAKATLVRGAVAFLVALTAIVAGLSAAFSPPASAAAGTHQTVIASTATRAEAGPQPFAIPRPRAPASCETRGCRAASFARSELVVLFVRVLPGQRYQLTACAYES